MRPHRLELAAFGAFPGDVELDLDRLGAGGLVLLCGETGGGKTTLLDALGFALYGVVPGLRGVRDLRSHHAPADSGPWARLEFSVPAGRFRVARTGGWDRPRRRGGGTSRINPTAVLERWTGTGWTAFATRNEDVGHEIGLLLGMRPEQFFQVVMLPQGRFADFLHADNDTREALLKQLFSVGMFERVEGWLADRAKRAADDHGLARQALDRLRVAVAETAGLTLDDPVPVEPADPDWAASLASEARVDATAAARRREAAAVASAEAQQALVRAREADQRAAQRAVLRARLAELDRETPAIERTAAEIAAATRAAGVRGAVAEAARRDEERQEAAIALAAARATLATATVAPATAAAPTVAAPATAAPATAGPVTAGPATVAPAAQALAAPPDATATELATLGALAHAESGRLEQVGLALAAADDEDREARAADAAQLEHAQAAAIRAAEIDTTLPTRRATIEARLTTARQAAQLAPALRERSTALAALAVAVRARHAALAEASAAAQAAARARSAAADLRQQRFDAITAELAAALADGGPCPVCGALDHPDPTEVRADHVSKDAERAADAEADGRERAAAAARDQLVAATERVSAGLARVLAAPAQHDGPADVLAELGGSLLDEAVLLADEAISQPDSTQPDAAQLDLTQPDPTQPELSQPELSQPDEARPDARRPDNGRPDPRRTAVELTAVAAAFAAAADEAAASAGALAGAESELAQVAEAERRARQDLVTRDVQEREAGARAAAARTRAARTLATVPTDLRDPAALGARIEALAGFARASEQARRHAEVSTQADEEARRAAATAAHAARAAGFPDPAAALAAAREPGWLAPAESRVQAHRDERARVRARLDDPELAEPAVADVPLAAREQADADAKAAFEAAVADAATADARARRLTSLVGEYAAAHAAAAPLAANAAQLRQLADLATGRPPVNQHGMPLSSYVLAARLEEVARAASERLAAMSGGRYRLVHDPGDRRDRRRKAGLGLLVEDAWTGRARPTATLSGGETFQAALSLALGLADVVSAEAGGHAIDALFVDEGFGTLDPDSLDEVMTVLDDLRSGGRLVGVVSHVADLRQRIPTQIRVRKGPSGSTVETTS